jgi:hypothetical protein
MDESSSASSVVSRVSRQQLIRDLRLRSAAASVYGSPLLLCTSRAGHMVHVAVIGTRRCVAEAGELTWATDPSHPLGMGVCRGPMTARSTLNPRGGTE